MRTIWALLLAACATLGACSDSSDDPLAEKCAAACTVAESHPCVGEKQKCINDCRQQAGAAADNKTYLKGCADCIAGDYSYSVKTDPPCSATSTEPKCCWGIVKTQGPTGAKCASSCIEPDAGAL